MSFLVTKSWQDKACWRVLDTCFQDGQHFFATWQRCLDDPHAPWVLHYVALCPQAPNAHALNLACLSQQITPELARQLRSHWFGLLPGFHRFLLSNGRVALTLCVGDALSLLREQDFFADTLVICRYMPTQPGELDLRDKWSAKALASCCRRGTEVLAHGCNPDALAQATESLCQAGFVIDTTWSADTSGLHHIGQFAPEWPVKSSRRARATAAPVQRCAVVGAGLAGASVAATLAQRGWQVQVLDLAATPAAGASGLPVGLVVPHVSGDDCVLSRLSRAGVRLMLQEAQRCLQHDVNWAASGVFERQIAGTPRLPSDWPSTGGDWSQPGAPAFMHADDCIPKHESCFTLTADTNDAQLGAALWHPKAAWIKPAALVRAWLDHANITFVGQTRITGLRKAGSVWQLLDASGAVCAQAEHVVLANAGGAPALMQSAAAQNPALANVLARLPAVQGIRGLLSWAVHAHTLVPQASFPNTPVNGSGAMVAHIPTAQGSAWFMGSSYQPAKQIERSDHDNHLRNLEHLQQLDPTLAQDLASAFHDGTVQAWKGTRCVSADRLPLVGPLDDGDPPSLWLCAAMGSRGLSFSVLCAQLLAARMGAEPLPVPVKMARALDALRAKYASSPY